MRAPRTERRSFAYLASSLSDDCLSFRIFACRDLSSGSTSSSDEEDEDEEDDDDDDDDDDEVEDEIAEEEDVEGEDEDRPLTAEELAAEAAFWADTRGFSRCTVDAASHPLGRKCVVTWLVVREMGLAFVPGFGVATDGLGLLVL